MGIRQGSWADLFPGVLRCTQQDPGKYLHACACVCICVCIRICVCVLFISINQQNHENCYIVQCEIWVFQLNQAHLHELRQSNSSLLIPLQIVWYTFSNSIFTNTRGQCQEYVGSFWNKFLGHIHKPTGIFCNFCPVTNNDSDIRGRRSGFYTKMFTDLSEIRGHFITMFCVSSDHVPHPLRIINHVLHYMQKPLECCVW